MKIVARVIHIIDISNKKKIVKPKLKKRKEPSKIKRS